MGSRCVSMLEGACPQACMRSDCVCTRKRDREVAGSYSVVPRCVGSGVGMERETQPPVLCKALGCEEVRTFATVSGAMQFAKRLYPVCIHPVCEMLSVSAQLLDLPVQVWRLREGHDPVLIASASVEGSRDSGSGAGLSFHHMPRQVAASV